MSTWNDLYCVTCGGPCRTFKLGYTKGPDMDHISQFFDINAAATAPELQLVADQYLTLARWLYNNVPKNPERTVALRKLLESRDSALRAESADPMHPSGTNGG